MSIWRFALFLIIFYKHKYDFLSSTEPVAFRYHIIDIEQF